MKKSDFFVFGIGKNQGGSKEILGGKGANLAEMSNLGMSVPPGFVISTRVCRFFYENKEELPSSFFDLVDENIASLERSLKKKFGSSENPLLLSVRSGAPVSMPGMMDTILNLGLNEKTVQGLSKNSQNERFAWDSYRRFIQMYSNVVLGMNSSVLEVILEDLKEEKGYTKDTDLKAEDLKLLVKKFKEEIKDLTGKIFPSDVKEQLSEAILAVMKSWKNPRAMTYRNLNDIDHEMGTAVNVQSMVFGNLGEDSATGVAFTRNPSTGEKSFFGEYLINAQGEDVVAGLRTPLPISKASSRGDSLEENMPSIFKQLKDISKKLEKHYKDMQEIEFTVEKGKLWMLQTRSGKRTAPAGLKIALDMMNEKLVTKKEALLRVSPGILDQLLHPSLDKKEGKTPVTRGLPASPGAATGKVVFSSEDVVSWKQKGEKVILVRVETSPEDIEGMVGSEGVLTSRGGMTSHAAVVARGMGKCCVAGCAELEIDLSGKKMKIKGQTVSEGDTLTLDGSTGEVFLGEMNMQPPCLNDDFKTFMELADVFKSLKVRANADTPEDARIAREFGAQGIGLCRTEHMFFGKERIDLVRQMILSDSLEQRDSFLEKLLPFQKSDFKSLFEVMSGLPVTIRLLDPPLHEFLPQTEKEIETLSEKWNVSKKQLKQKVTSLHEFNPMLGHRGCRLAVTYPEIYLMQARAISEAVIEVLQKGNQKVFPEIMIPLISSSEELKHLKGKIQKEISRVQKQKGRSFEYTLGTMMELPRACFLADEIADHVDFFSFGTNDLTQTTLGLSRDDSGRFLETYLSEGLYKQDPFVSIDRRGVGRLLEIAIELGKKRKNEIKLGVCGEHGGDPASIAFFDELQLSYVSCSPYRVPTARLAAAQAHLLRKEK